MISFSKQVQMLCLCFIPPHINNINIHNAINGCVYMIIQNFDFVISVFGDPVYTAGIPFEFSQVSISNLQYLIGQVSLCK